MGGEMTTSLLSLHDSIRSVLVAARTQVRQMVNSAMVQAYWQIGRLIVEDEQGGLARAEYGKQVLEDLSRRLTEEFGKGFTPHNLRNFRQFYLTFPESEICYALRSELTWTHYRILMRVERPEARHWYLQEAVSQGWSVRALERQINTLFYERLLSSQNQAGLHMEAASRIAEEVPVDPRDFIRDPYVLEFLGAR
ncbi:MAG: DUF1016 domain-containing protein, partial [Magnetococcales bacterium]|nr:DUF1016 domain-containing protein [Magnetococcales bacterium]